MYVQLSASTHAFNVTKSHICTGVKIVALRRASEHENIFISHWNAC